MNKGREPAFAVQYFFLLKLFLAFVIFFGNRKEVQEALMTTGELFAVAVLFSVVLAVAAGWQNDDGGGLI
jgi:hypothetical protein